jgi:hypothetical protein
MSGIFICIADGMADYLPNSQEYHHCGSVEDLRELLRDAVEGFRAEYPIGSDPYVHWLMDHHYDMISERGASSLNWRLCIARHEDRVLDVIGMTEEEFEQQACGEF